MTRYFFHLGDGLDYLLDKEGLDLVDLDIAKQEALAYARDTLSHDIRNGVLDLRYRIDVHDEAGKMVHRLRMENAVDIIIA